MAILLQVVGVFLLLSQFRGVAAFTGIVNKLCSARTVIRTRTPLDALPPQPNNDLLDNASLMWNDDSTKNSSRRTMLQSLMSCGALFLSRNDPAFAASALGSKSNPIVVMGAGGKVGTLCTKILASQNLYAIATTRSGRAVAGENPFITYKSCDVTQLDQVQECLKGASGVIFAASASGAKKGGDPAHVDYLGVYNTARACLDHNVAKLAVVSAASATRPESAGFKATNYFVNFVYGPKIMDYKIAGEAVMRDLYQASNKPSCSYTVIRPGGLSDRPSAGSSKVHISQGDVYASEISREDVALVTVAALLNPSTAFTTFELNQVDGLVKSLNTLPDLPPELVHTGAATYDELVSGLLTDSAMKSKYPNLVNNFRGEGIEPVSQLA